MERAHVLLWRSDESVQPEGVQAVHRGFQSLSQRLHPLGISERCKNRRPVGIAGRRLCRRKAPSVIRIDGRGQEETAGDASNDPEMAQATGSFLKVDPQVGNMEFAPTCENTGSTLKRRWLSKARSANGALR